jgi:hypothetical protein
VTAPRYAVIATEADGHQTAYGPFSNRIADAAVSALLESGSDTAVALYLYSSADLSAELPDWKRVAS